MPTDPPTTKNDLSPQEQLVKPPETLNGAKSGALVGLTWGMLITTAVGLPFFCLGGGLVGLKLVIIELGTCIVAGAIAGYITAAGLVRTKHAATDNLLLGLSGAIGGLFASFLGLFIYFGIELKTLKFDDAPLWLNLSSDASISGMGSVVGMIVGAIAAWFLGILSGQPAGTSKEPSFQAIAARRIKSAAVGTMLGASIALCGPAFLWMFWTASARR